MGERDDAPIRAFRDEVLEHVAAKRPLVDVRSPEEYPGRAAPHAGISAGGRASAAAISPAPRASPGPRRSIPETHTFRPASELRTLYEQENGLTRDGDRSSTAGSASARPTRGSR